MPSPVEANTNSAAVLHTQGQKRDVISKEIGFSSLFVPAFHTVRTFYVVVVFFVVVFFPPDSRALVNTMQKSRIVGLQSLGCLRSSVVPFNGAH